MPLISSSSLLLAQSQVQAYSRGPGAPDGAGRLSAPAQRAVPEDAFLLDLSEAGAKAAGGITPEAVQATQRSAESSPLGREVPAKDLAARSSDHAEAPAQPERPARPGSLIDIKV